MGTYAAVTPARNREFLHSWKIRQKGAPLATPQEAAMCSLDPGWRQNQEDIWQANLDALADFVGTHGAFPRRSSDDLAETKLSNWVATQRFRIELLSADRLRLLDERLPFWSQPGLWIWHKRLDEVCALAEDAGTIPKWSRTDAESMRASSWLRGNRKLAPNDPRRRTLDERLPGWDESFNDKWARRLHATVEFVDRHGRLPRPSESDPADRECGLWLQDQRERPSAERRLELDARLPGWDKNIQDKWTDALDFCVEYHARTGELPSSSDADPSVAFHGRWLKEARRQRTNNESRAEALKRRLPAEVSREEKWLATLELAAQYLSVHGSLPSKKSKDARVAVVGVWLGTQRAGKGLTPAREAALDKRLPGWRDPRVGRPGRQPAASAHMG